MPSPVHSVMTRLAAPFLGALLVAAPALAQQGTVRLTAQTFISPSGEPFRAKASEPYPIAQWIEKVDTDGDGRISYAEFEADAERFFKVVDANGDGMITAAENTRYEQQIAPEILIIDPRVVQPRNALAYNPEMGQDPTRGRYIRRLQGASQYGLIDEPQPIRAADQDFNFRISFDEWMTATDSRFGTLDANDDNYLTADELPMTPLQYGLANPAGEGRVGGKPRKAQ